MLKTLTVEGLQRLRPTDIGWLQPLLRDAALLDELNLVTRRWRQR
ncbi:hypothetical protein [Streptomyces sp. NBC_01171]|nr:hypothetical protein OG448_29900 [Streptomyces sp. NBC_01171]